MPDSPPPKRDRRCAQQWDLARKLDDLERKLAEHDDKFAVVFEAIRQLMTPAPDAQKKRKIGFARE